MRSVSDTLYRPLLDELNFSHNFFFPDEVPLIKHLLQGSVRNIRLEHDKDPNFERNMNRHFMY